MTVRFDVFLQYFIKVYNTDLFASFYLFQGVWHSWLESQVFPSSSNNSVALSTNFDSINITKPLVHVIIILLIAKNSLIGLV